MKSAPCYSGLVLREGARGHLFASCAQGALAVGRVLDGALWTGLEAEVLHWDTDEGSRVFGDVLPAASGLRTRRFGGGGEFFSALREALGAARAGVHFYVAGPEVFVWDAHAEGRRAGLALSAVSHELAGSRARRVSCVHCKAMNEGVTGSPHRCCGCGQALLVRDHFSRALAAYVGVRIDAEEPGAVPEVEEMYR